MCDWIAVSGRTGQEIFNRISGGETVKVRNLKEEKLAFVEATARQAQQAIAEGLTVFEVTMGGVLMQCRPEVVANAVAQAPPIKLDRPNYHRHEKRRPMRTRAERLKFQVALLGATS